MREGFSDHRAHVRGTVKPKLAMWRLLRPEVEFSAVLNPRRMRHEAVSLFKTALDVHIADGHNS
jgi:hypothetical protein